MRITNKLMLACGDGYYKTTRWMGEPKSNWKKATKKAEKKKLREFLLSSIEEDERELAKLIEFHSYWED